VLLICQKHCYSGHLKSTTEYTMRRDVEVVTSSIYQTVYPHMTIRRFPHEQLWTRPSGQHCRNLALASNDFKYLQNTAWRSKPPSSITRPSHELKTNIAETVDYVCNHWWDFTGFLYQSDEWMYTTEETSRHLYSIWIYPFWHLIWKDHV
jgi:hypothetical protein